MHACKTLTVSCTHYLLVYKVLHKKQKYRRRRRCTALISGIAVTSHSLFCFKDGFDHPPKQIFLTPILHKMKIPTIDAIVVIIRGLCCKSIKLCPLNLFLCSFRVGSSSSWLHRQESSLEVHPFCGGLVVLRVGLEPFFSHPVWWSSSSSMRVVKS